MDRWIVMDSLKINRKGLSETGPKTMFHHRSRPFPAEASPYGNAT